MKSVKAELSEKLKCVELHTFSDWHIGDELCDMQSIKEEVDRVKETPNAYCILNGDLCNTATRTSVSDIYSEKMSIMEQIQTCIDLLEPIKDKILFITNGNHENRIYKSDGIDIMKIIAKQLDLQDKYCREGGVLFLRFGRQETRNHCRKQSYAIYITHGNGGGKRAGAKVNRLEDLAGIVDADIYIHGHTHLPLIFKQGFYRLSWQNSTVAFLDKLFVNSSAQLDYGGYGQIECYKPSSKCPPVIYLNGCRREMVARL